MALLGGADFIIELPVHAACASAGYFADGGIALLCHTGVVTHLGFGSESGDLDFLLRHRIFFITNLRFLRQHFQTPSVRA